MKLQQVNLMRHQRRPSGAWGIGRMLRWGGMLVAVLVMFSVANCGTWAMSSATSRT